MTAQAHPATGGASPPGGGASPPGGGASPPGGGASPPGGGASPPGGGAACGGGAVPGGGAVAGRAVRLVGVGAAVRLVFAGLLGVATELAGVGLVATATWMIVRAAEQPPLAALAVAIAGVRGFALLKGGLRYAERLAGHDAVLRVLADVRTRVFAALAADRRTVTGAARKGGGDELSRVVSDVDAVQDAILRGVLPAAVAAVVGAGAVVVTAVVAPAAGLVLAAGLLVAGVLLPLAGHTVSRRASADIAAARGAVTASAVDVVHGVAELTAYGALPAALDRAAADGRRLARLESRAATVSAVVGGIAALVPALMAVLIALVVDGNAAAVLALVALTVGEVVVPLASAAVRQAELRGALARVRGLIAAVPAEAVEGFAPAGPGPFTAPAEAVEGVAAARRGAVTAPAEAVEGVAAARPGAVTAPAEDVERGEPVPGAVGLRLSGVTVRYPGAQRAALDSVDLELPAGRRVAVVGSSGAGKSTLLAVLAGRIAVAGGSVDGLPAGVERWRIANGVFADAHVFHDTVRENVSLSRDGISDDDVRRALVDAGLGEYRDRLDDVVGEDGSRLSGGQRQRLLLARALVRAPAVLLLDEPTEGLDAAAADAVLATALAAAGGRTVVVVTHRQADLARFDDVVRVEDGRLSRN
ncbi:ATP-binding cassette domain-containing protein [Dactylosporangium sp. AC04546]|uniref:amino acid ABC transporter ATP-binding/permease protein n=1 Tax=Dactylosporangium sp. AC04546 TaxID=2862460 RepID=UPI001EE0E9D4|nr:ATP-binding cassette domain-containing protein [Dactylosporangium sp. AC04546]WVK85482.1 ATP-binding cassette domain-containing protein [Dactylosporangium sp. AC04546]